MNATAWMAGAGPAAMSLRAWLAVLLLAAAALFPGITAVPVMDRDEGRYLQATKQMLETGDYVDIRLQDQPRYGYPIGTYWVKAASAALFGGSEAPAWAYRLPSFVAGMIAVLGTAWLAARIGGPAAGVAAGVLLAVSLVVAVESRTGRSDALLLAAVVVTQAALWRITRMPEERPAFLGAPAVFWVAHGLGVLFKGPIITLVVALTIAALCLWSRDRALLRRLRILPGLAVTAAIVLPWLLAITVRTGPAYLQEALGSSMMGKVAEGDRAHGAPPGYHLLVLFVAFWPGALLAGAAAALAWTRRREADIRFLVCWLVPTFLVFEAVATKLPHYTMPTYPALAILAGLVLATGFRPAGRGRWMHWVAVGLFCSVTLALAVVPFLGAAVFGQSFIAGVNDSILWSSLRDAGRRAWDETGFAAAAFFTGLGILFAGLWTLNLRAREQVLGSVGVAVLVSTFYATVFQTVFPALNSLWPSRTLAGVVDRLQGCDVKSVAITGYAEPSVVFYLGTDTGLRQPEDAADLLRRDPACGIAVAAEPDQAAFLEAVATAGVAVKLAAEVHGFNYTRGKPVQMSVYLAEGSRLSRN